MPLLGWEEDDEGGGALTIWPTSVAHAREDSYRACTTSASKRSSSVTKQMTSYGRGCYLSGDTVGLSSSSMIGVSGVVDQCRGEES
jgi:hypothetical protein